MLSHYLNGGIRMQGSRPRVRPAVKAHISVILGLLALVKAVGYYLARFNLDLSSNGYVQGAGYTDVHARLPALELLILVSLAAAVLLIYNIRRQGWALPILGVGLWFLVALTAGTIYPAAVQALKVNPAPEHARAALHPAQYRRHPTGHGHHQRPEHLLSGATEPDRRPNCRPTATPWPTSGCGIRPRPSRRSTNAGSPHPIPVQRACHRSLQGERDRDPVVVGVPGSTRATCPPPRG